MFQIKNCLYILGAGIFLSSCNNSTNDTINTKDSLTVANDTSKAKVDSISFGTQLVDEKKKCKMAFESIKSSSDFLQAYHLLCDLEKDMNKIYDKWNPNLEYEELSKQTDEMMGNALPWILSDLIAEGSYPISAIENKELLKSAQQSPEKDDDFFVNFLLATYGEGGSRKNGLAAWNTMNCDVCWSSTLGSGDSFKVLRKADSIRTLYPQYQTDVDSNTVDFFNLSYNTYESSQSEIIGEVNQILASIKLTDEQRQKLMTFREAITDTSKSHLQIDCAHRQCSYY